ncbi:MAG TPA: phage tail protein [Ilumatobacter sp.]|nr:phage tail protein [Ilumatobacter sp.]
MAIQRRDPYRNFNFRVAIGGRARANDGFSAVRLPTLLTRPDVAVDAEEALGEDSSHLVLRRGFTGALDLNEWWMQERGPKGSRGRIVTVELLDETNTEVAVAWRFTGCRPVALHYSSLDALESAVVTETIVLAFDDVEMS